MNTKQVTISDDSIQIRYADGSLDSLTRNDDGQTWTLEAADSSVSTLSAAEVRNVANDRITEIHAFFAESSPASDEENPSTEETVAAHSGEYV